MTEIRNFGILAAISWNSNRWTDRATTADIDCSNFDYVIENGRMHEDINFGHEIYPCEHDGSYIAYTPMFNKLPATANLKYVEFVFFRSLNHSTKTNYIIGFYAHPQIGHFERTATHPYYRDYDWGNVKAMPEHIVLFDQPIPISKEIVLKENYLPKGKDLGHQGFNYLGYDNVLKILDKASALNPTDNKLKGIKFKALTKKQG
jgi:5-methylcytosine-specific restriction enzyme A